MKGSYLLLVPLLLLSSEANAQYDEPLSRRVARPELESCIYLRAYRSVIKENSVEEFIYIVLQ
jgi:hypothetical protein